MAQKITMPALSPTMTEGTLARWLKQEGDTVEAGEVIAEIETDKATMEVEAVDDGILAKILVPEGTEGVTVQSIIAILKEEGDTDESIDALLIQEPQEQEEAEEPQEPEEQEEAKPVDKKEKTQSAGNDRIKASPRARRLAEERGMDLTDTKGSGPGGRIVEADIEDSGSDEEIVKADVEKTNAPKAPSDEDMDARALADALGMRYEIIKLDKVRKTIAERLTLSKQTIPHYTLSVSCEIDALLDLRSQYNTLHEDSKISINDLAVKATASALTEVPEVNAAWAGDAVLRFADADVAVAVTTETGLVTPVVKAAQTKDIATIAAEIRALAARARQDKSKPEEFQGGTFTVSNLGMFGIESFTAIINPPQAGILAIGQGRAQPVVTKDGELAIATVMQVTLSADHRVMDGMVGAQFLAAFKRLIETPLGLVLQEKASNER
ncbi:MAG: pyruvate dehydrogenase complex dihydrolipoamide acetyltransferase [Pseudomonadota bacterium]|nr:pyruvate dehydrogenase complex dihydrolipoamide acetyltransferase [Pseudomonadota bacterium]